MAYSLKADYPMIAPNYSENRRAMAHKIGLGRKAKAVLADAGEAVVKPARKDARAAKEAAKAHLGG